MGMFDELSDDGRPLHSLRRTHADGFPTHARPLDKLPGLAGLHRRAARTWP